MHGWRTYSGDTSSVSDVEDPGVVLLPREISPKLLRDVRFAPSREANHNDDKFRGDISIGNFPIRRYKRSSHTGNTEGCRMGSYARCLGTGVLSQGWANPSSQY